MAGCIKCDSKDKEIQSLKALVEFHKKEENSWRKLFNEQRGGEVFDQLQTDYAEINAENIIMTRAIARYLELIGSDT